MRILLVEDNKEDVILFKKELDEVDSSFEIDSFVVGVCHSVTEALTEIDRQRFDIILLDLRLPDAENLEGLREIIDYSQNKIPIVVYSGLYRPELAREALAIGAQDYIVKGTFGKTELVRTLLHAKIRHSWFVNIKRLEAGNGDDAH